MGDLETALSILLNLRDFKSAEKLSDLLENAQSKKQFFNRLLNFYLKEQVPLEITKSFLEKYSMHLDGKEVK